MALIQACKDNDITVIKMLLENGEDPHTTHNNGIYPMLYAYKTGNVNLIKILLRYTTINKVEIELTKLEQKNSFRHLRIKQLLSDYKISFVLSSLCKKYLLKNVGLDLTIKILSDFFGVSMKDIMSNLELETGTPNLELETGAKSKK